MDPGLAGVNPGLAGVDPGLAGVDPRLAGVDPGFNWPCTCAKPSIHAEPPGERAQRASKGGRVTLGYQCLPGCLLEHASAC